jgi:uncharacterized protein involved in exopolysaccharide biosynthesis
MSTSLPATRLADGNLSEDRSVIDILTALLLHWRRILLAAVAVGLIALGGGMLLPPVYTATASILAQAAGGSASRIAGLASQFGISVGAAGGGPSPELYAKLLQSEALLRRAATATYTVVQDGRARQGNLAYYFDTDGDTPEERQANAVQELGDATSTSVDDASSLVNLSVTTKSPELSLQVAREMLSVLDDLNTTVRKKQADAESRFTQSRLEEQAAVLRATEERLQAFLARNRIFQNDPVLQLQYNRLNREVQMQQEVYTSLAQGYQQVRIDAVRNTPTISVMTQPMLPQVPRPRHLALLGVVGVILGAALAIITVLAQEYVRYIKHERPHAYARAEAAWRRMWADLRRGRWSVSTKRSQHSA